jgi:hypothetical protein
MGGKAEISIQVLWLYCNVSHGSHGSKQDETSVNEVHDM